MDNKIQRLVSLILRLGLAFAFIYPPLAAFGNPQAWVGYLPLFISKTVPDEIVFLHIFGAFEIIIAIWFLWGRALFYPSIIAVFILALIIILNWAQISVLFRDISIILMAIALAIMHAPKLREN